MSYDTLKAKIEQLIEKAQTSGGEAIQYTDIIYNDDNTVTLIDTKGIEHTITCVYENNRLWSMTYDGKEVVTVYNDGKLVAVGETEVDVVNAPLDNTLENIIDQSGVLDSTDGTVEDKVGQLVDYASFKAIIQESLYANYNYSVRLFHGTSVKDVSMFDFSKTKNLSYGFIESKLEKLIIDASNVANMQDMCADCKNLKSVEFTNETFVVSNIVNAFNGCSALETINILDISNCPSLGSGQYHYPFGGCVALKEIRFVENCIKGSGRINSSPLLSPESIQSIVDGLATVETAQTLTLHKDVKAKLTQTQLATITGKNWNLA